LETTNIDTRVTRYTRRGRLSINEFGNLCVGDARDGWILEPQITIPIESVGVRITPNGTVTYGDGHGSFSHAGQLQLSIVGSNALLDEVATGMFRETNESGPPMIGEPSYPPFGMLQQGWLRLEEESRPWNWQSVAIGATLIVMLAMLIELRQLQGRVGDAGR